MKKLITFIAAACISMQLNAGSFYEQLCAYNYNWKYYSSFVPNEQAHVFSSDREYVQAHLVTVIPILKNASTAQLSTEQTASRRQMIEWLSAYCEQGNFPQNYYCPQRIPVFIDEHNTHCAVGYLMQQSGHEDMAQRISANYQYQWLKDIKDPELASWQEASGLSLDELKLVQGAYDSYLHNALVHPKRLEIPQKPEVMTLYFEGKNDKSDANTWVKGEGAGKILNGKWIQNYAYGKPWIEGYYEDGKRTGLWKEYYQGTTQLCRTENWRNDKLNGIRKRYDKSGMLIEEILFKDGKAALKTNYELSTGLKYVRRQLDSLLVFTEIYTLDGLLLASGNEKIYNPGNLQWFQNIELTALNTFSVAASKPKAGSYQQPGLYNVPPLVEYHKEGNWAYYPEYNYTATKKTNLSFMQKLARDFFHFGYTLYAELNGYSKLTLTGETRFDSILVNYTNNKLCDFYGYGNTGYAHLHITYQPSLFTVPDNFYPAGYGSTFKLRYPQPGIKTIGQYNKTGEKIGEWDHYDESGSLYKIETFLIPRKEEELSISGF